MLGNTTEDRNLMEVKYLLWGKVWTLISKVLSKEWVFLHFLIMWTVPGKVHFTFLYLVSSLSHIRMQLLQICGEIHGFLMMPIDRSLVERKYVDAPDSSRMLAFPGLSHTMGNSWEN